MLDLIFGLICIYIFLAILLIGAVLFSCMARSTYIYFKYTWNNIDIESYNSSYIRQKDNVLFKIDHTKTCAVYLCFCFCLASIFNCFLYGILCLFKNDLIVNILIYIEIGLVFIYLYLHSHCILHNYFKYYNKIDFWNLFDECHCEKYFQWECIGAENVQLVYRNIDGVTVDKIKKFIGGAVMHLFVIIGIYILFSGFYVLIQR